MGFRGIYGLTFVVLGALAFYVAFSARDFRASTTPQRKRKRMPGWVGRLWFVVWGSLAMGFGLWTLLHR